MLAEVRRPPRSGSPNGDSANGRPGRASAGSSPYGTKNRREVYCAQSRTSLASRNGAAGTPCVIPPSRISALVLVLSHFFSSVAMTLPASLRCARVA